jgi:hypothetical protein
MTHRGGNKRYDSYLNSPSSNKRYSERISRCTTYVKQDKSHKRVYQLSSKGEIIKSWHSINDIASHFNVELYKVRYYIANQKIVGGSCLFVMQFDYKSTIDYRILFAYLKQK